MSKIEKIQRYIDKYGLSRNRHYDMSAKEMLAIATELSEIEGIATAFLYGRAKGYRAAKAERRAKA